MFHIGRTDRRLAFAIIQSRTLRKILSNNFWQYRQVSKFLTRHEFGESDILFPRGLGFLDTFPDFFLFNGYAQCGL